MKVHICAEVAAAISDTRELNNSFKCVINISSKADTVGRQGHGVWKCEV